MKAFWQKYNFLNINDLVKCAFKRRKGLDAISLLKTPKVETNSLFLLKM